jgi:hypothetical protein
MIIEKGPFLFKEKAPGEKESIVAQLRPILFEI